MGLPASDSVWSSSTLLEKLQRGDNFFILDVRNRDEFERYRIEGRHALPSFNVPYFEMLELGGKDEMLDSVVAYLDRDLSNTLPRDLPILAACAKGDTSEYVMQGLQQLGYRAATLAGGLKAWGQHYAVSPLIETAGLSVYQLSRPARGCLSYVVASNGRAVVIDPLRHLDPYLALVRSAGLTIEAIVDTHAHADHISGGPALAARTGAPYFLHPYDGIHPFDMLPAKIHYEFLRDGQSFTFGAHKLEVMHIPGHTLGLVALRLDDQYLFAGDSIFIRSIARPDLGGKADAWAALHGRSLRKLLTLPDAIHVLPGHFSGLDESDQKGHFAATLGDLKKQNDGLVVLQRESDEGFVRYLIESLPKMVPEYIDIKRVNAGLLSPNEDDASTLELGKNACALSQAHAVSGGMKS